MVLSDAYNDIVGYDREIVVTISTPPLGHGLEFQNRRIGFSLQDRTVPVDFQNRINGCPPSRVSKKKNPSSRGCLLDVPAPCLQFARWFPLLRSLLLLLLARCSFLRSHARTLSCLLCCSSTTVHVRTRRTSRTYAQAPHASFASARFLAPRSTVRVRTARTSRDFPHASYASYDTPRFRTLRTAPSLLLMLSPVADASSPVADAPSPVAASSVADAPSPDAAGCVADARRVTASRHCCCCCVDVAASGVHARFA